MKPIQRYLKYISEIKLMYLIALFIFLYIFTATAFAAVYYYWKLISHNPEPADYLYFSFITQSTVGYGDYSPVGLGKLVAVVQTITGLILFALGTGVIVARILLPSRNSIEFDKHIIFDPLSRQFRFRYVNRLPFDLYMANIEVRFRHIRITESGKEKISRKKVSLLRSLVTYIPSLKPIQTSTQRIEHIQGMDGLKAGEDVILEPGHLIKNALIKIIVSSQYFAGNLVVTKEYGFNDIKCGTYQTTYSGFGDIDWKKWNKYNNHGIGACAECFFSDCCVLSDLAVCGNTG